MRKSLAVLLALALLAPMAARAEDYVMLGLGTRSCGEYQKFDLTDPTTQYSLHSWVAGYISAYNIFTVPHRGKFADLSALTQTMVFDTLSSFCAAHPDEVLAVGIDDIIRKLPEKPYLQKKRP